MSKQLKAYRRILLGIAIALLVLLIVFFTVYHLTDSSWCSSMSIGIAGIEVGVLFAVYIVEDFINSIKEVNDNDNEADFSENS